MSVELMGHCVRTRRRTRAGKSEEAHSPSDAYTHLSDALYDNMYIKIDARSNVQCVFWGGCIIHTGKA